MMKLSKRTISLFIVLSMIFIFSGCKGSNNTEHEAVQSFEYYIYPEEYEEAYSEFNKSYELEPDKEYQVMLNAICESGTMEIFILTSENEQKFEVNPIEPCDEKIIIPVNSSEVISFIVIIGAETSGSVKGQLLSR